MLTVEGGRAIVSRAMGYGVIDYKVKPLRTGELRERLAKHLDTVPSS